MFLFWMQSEAFYYARSSSKNTRQNNFLAGSTRAVKNGAANDE